MAERSATVSSLQLSATSPPIGSSPLPGGAAAARDVTSASVASPLLDSNGADRGGSAARHASGAPSVQERVPIFASSARRAGSSPLIAIVFAARDHRGSICLLVLTDSRQPARFVSIPCHTST
jgi:hypothetical protein